MADVNVTTTGSILVGTTEKKEVAANSVLTLGHSKGTGEIGFWRFTGTEIPAYRAYIADFPSGTDGARIGHSMNSISEKGIGNSDKFATAVYDLQGRSLQAEAKMWKKNAKGQIIIIR